MATRCGDVDPTIPLYLQKHCGLSAGEVDTLLNKKSGLAGMCGNSDLRSVLADDSPQAKLAIEVRTMEAYKGHHGLQSYFKQHVPKVPRIANYWNVSSFLISVGFTRSCTGICTLVRSLVDSALCPYNI